MLKFFWKIYFFRDFPKVFSVSSSFNKTINPPEAIRNLVTPVATPRSVTPGFFNPSGHTTVCQTGFFFSNTFCTRLYHVLIDRVFLSLFWPRMSVTIPWTQSVRPWYGHWRPSLKYLFRKTPVWQTVIWPLTSWSKMTF